MQSPGICHADTHVGLSRDAGGICALYMLYALRYAWETPFMHACLNKRAVPRQGIDRAIVEHKSTA